MSQSWILRPQVTPSPELVNAVGGHPLVAQLLAQRGVETPAKALPFLDPDLYEPAPPDTLIGVDVAARLLHAAITDGQNLLVWGDFDVDGQTSTALLVTALRTLAGDERVHFHVPNRFEESHGIKVDKLRAKLAGLPVPIHLLLSCDTGIAEAPAVGFAKDQGMTVVITDHHDLPAELQGLTPGVDALCGFPTSVVGAESVRRADAIVNPKFLPPDDPLRTLPGVGVAYKLVQQLYALAGRSGEEAELLDLVALGIVADVAEQIHDARYLLQRGLARLRATRRVGLLALMNISRIDPSALTADSIGFQLGPRMNALGRLDDATDAIELLTTRDALRAGQLAAKLERLNQDRRLLSSQTTRAALEMIEREPSLLEYNALVLAHPNWHAGVVGIVAAKLVEQFGKPAVLVLNPPGQTARGSARSVPGVDIGAAIAACSPLLLTHGGHPGAAGLSLLPEKIDAFRRELSRQIELHRDDSVQAGLQIDIATTLDALDLELATELARLAPFGQGNPTPQFVSYGLAVVDDRRMGREGTHRKLKVRLASAGDKGAALPVVWFGGADVDLPAGPLDLVYTLNVNEFKGERTLQLMYVDSRPAQAPQTTAPALAAATRRIYDWRDREVPLDQLPAPDQSVWYAEGARLENVSQGVAYAPRTQVHQGAADQPLVVWSIPPTPALLQWLLETSSATVVHLCAHETSNDSWPDVLRTVGSMCKYALARDGVVDVGRMAARLGLTEAIVRQSLLWLENRGIIQVAEWLEGDRAQIAVGSGQPSETDVTELQTDLDAQLAEVRAYRRFFHRAKLATLGVE